MAMSWRCQRSAQLWCDSVSFVWMTQSSVILEKTHHAEVRIRMLAGSCEIEFYTARCQRQWATPLPRARVTLEAIIETISRCHALTRTRFLPQWDLEGPTYSKMSARALRVQPGGAALRGRPSHVAAAAVQRRARPDCRHDCFACCSSQAGTNTPCMAALAWFLGPRVGPQLPPLCCPRRMPTGAVPVPHPGHIPWRVVARAWPCGTHGHAHAHVKRPGARQRRAT